jgi:hypothetical protein
MNKLFYIIGTAINSEMLYQTNVIGEASNVRTKAKSFLTRESAILEFEKRELEKSDFLWSILPDIRTVKSDIHLFNMFALNYSHNFIKEIWKGDENKISHLESKWFLCFNVTNNYGAMLKFWSELDGSNRETLENWILENYKG